MGPCIRFPLRAASLLVTRDLATKTTTQIDLKKDLGVKASSGLTTAPSSGKSFWWSDAGGDRVIKSRQKWCSRQRVLGMRTAMFKSAQGELFPNRQGLACTPQGVLFVADSGTPASRPLIIRDSFSFRAGKGVFRTRQLKYPVSIAWDKAIASTWRTSAIKKLPPLRQPAVSCAKWARWGLRLLWNRGRSPLTWEGNLFVLDVARGRVVAYDPQGVYLGGFGTLGKAVGFLNHPRDFALNENGDLLIAEEGRCAGLSRRPFWHAGADRTLLPSQEKAM